TDTNTVLSSTAVPIADTIVVGGTSTPVPVNTTCSDTLSASEPDTATVSCFCTADKNANFLATAKDTAKFQCLTPGLGVTKTCLVQDASGNSEVDVELMNTGTADLANCVVTDNVFPNDPTCPPTTTTSNPVTVPGGVALANCAITDNSFEDDKTCPPTGTGTLVATTPATIASLDPGAMASAMGSVSGLTADACDDVAVTCDVAGASGRTVTSKDE